MREKSVDSSAHKPGTLYIVGTPIGNLQDTSFRVLEVLQSVDLIAAEDTRRTRKLLSHFDIHTQLTSCFAHNEHYKATELVQKLQRGTDVALVTSAGMPTISDPGLHTIATAINQEIPIIPVPGPCALTLALAVSGFPTNRFVFEGFLGRTRKTRKARLKKLVAEGRTIIVYEAPHRILKTLTDIHAVLGNREIVLARELTKKHEELIRGTVAELQHRFDTRKPRGEFTIIIRGTE
jgi:16S rRNA (cytidine1402-2'-O)-methyltransferase